MGKYRVVGRIQRGSKAGGVPDPTPTPPLAYSEQAGEETATQGLHEAEAPVLGAAAFQMDSFSTGPQSPHQPEDWWKGLPHARPLGSWGGSSCPRNSNQHRIGWNGEKKVELV